MTSNPIDWLYLFLRVAVLAYLGFGLLLYLRQETMIFYPVRTEADYPVTPASIGLPFESVFIRAEDGVRLHGWFVPAPQEKGVILFFHGNGGNISHRLDTLRLFNQLGFSTFIIDYRGYGRSDGSPGEAGMYLDARAAWQYLLTDRGYRPEQVVVFGRSLGGAIAAYLAQDTRAAGLVLESTLVSTDRYAGERYPMFPVGLLLRHHFPTLSYLRRVDRPVLVAHSPADEIIPYQHGRSLFEVAKPPKSWLELQGGHNDGFLRSGEGYLRGLGQFLDSVRPRP